MTMEQKRILRERISAFGSARWHEGYYDGYGNFDAMQHQRTNANFCLDEIEKLLNELN